MLYWVPPCNTNFRPSAAMRGTPTTYCQTFFGKHLSEAGEKLLLAEALLLEVDAVGVEEDGAAVAELRREVGLERVLRVLGDGEAELVRHRLKKHAVAGGALIGELERLDVAVLHEQHLDVLTADVADDVDVAEVVRRAHHVRDRLDDVDVGLDALLENVRRVARRAEAEHLDLRRPWPRMRSRSSASSSLVS